MTPAEGRPQGRGGFVPGVESRRASRSVSAGESARTWRARAATQGASPSERALRRRKERSRDRSGPGQERRLCAFVTPFLLDRAVVGPQGVTVSRARGDPPLFSPGWRVAARASAQRRHAMRSGGKAPSGAARRVGAGVIDEDPGPRPGLGRGRRSRDRSGPRGGAGILAVQRRLLILETLRNPVGGRFRRPRRPTEMIARGAIAPPLSRGTPARGRSSGRLSTQRPRAIEALDFC
jgi:hypothetical protein